LEIKGKDYVIRIFHLDRKELDDLAFCAYLSKKYPLWHKGIVVCACADVLDTRSVARTFLEKKIVLMEQVCLADMPQYSRMVKVRDEGLVVTVPIIKAYGLFKLLAEELLKIRENLE